MAEISTFKFILSATIVFISGLFIFSVIFKAYITMNKLQSSITNETDPQTETTIMLLSAVPWGLGIVYASLIIGVIYYMFKSKPKSSEPPLIGGFRGGY